MHAHTHTPAYMYTCMRVPHTMNWISFEVCLSFQAGLHHEAPWLGVIFSVGVPTS